MPPSEEGPRKEEAADVSAQVVHLAQAAEYLALTLRYSSSQLTQELSH